MIISKHKVTKEENCQWVTQLLISIYLAQSKLEGTTKMATHHSQSM